MAGARDISHAQRRLLVNGIASLGLTVAGYASAWLAYRGYPPPLNRLVWGVFSLVLFGYWVVVMIVAATRMRPGQSPGWRRTRQILEGGTFLGVNGVTWLFMPYGSTELQHATLLFSTSYCAATVLSSADEDAFTRWRIAIVMGSLAAVCVLERIPLWPYLTAYLITLAAVLVTFDMMIRRMIKDLRAARVDAEQARDARTQFLVAATHDLGQPLQASRLFHEQALRAHGPEERKDAAQAARAAFESMELLLHAMLDHLRLSGGSVATQAVDVPVADLFDGLVRQYAAAAALQTVSLAALPTDAVITTDRHLCERVLGNFVDNALRHGRARRIRLGARRLRDGRYRLFVADDGIGVADEDMAALFVDFAQGTQKGEGGFGLGLSSARRAAFAIGGKVGHEARWRAGAQFYLEL